MRTQGIIWISAISLATAAAVQSAMADVTSPSIKDMGKKYTTEKPKTEYYGTGSSGRLTEASELRVLVEDLLSSGEYEKAIPKAKKAVQLDPGDPSGHLFLARALTNKLYQSKEEIDEKLLAECIREWQMIRYHDADPTEQWEAGNQVKALNKIAKALEKEKLIKEKEKMMELAAKKEEASKLAAKDSAVQTEIKKDIATDKRQLAEEEKGKKRFRFF
jgi:hypothetical protein